MTDFPVVLTTAVDNTTDALAKHLNNLEAKIGIDDSAVVASLDYRSKILMPLDSMTRQAVMNGNFDIWQRGITSATLTDISTTFTADRFYDYVFDNEGTLPVLTRSRQSLTAGAINGAFYYSRLTTDGAGTSFGGGAKHNYQHKIKHGTRYLTDGKNVTVSFWAKSDIVDKKIGLYLIQSYGSGGSPTSDEDIVGINWTLTSSWVKYTHTFTTNTLTGKTFGTNVDDSLRIVLSYMWGTEEDDEVDASGAEDYVGAGDIDIAQVQLCAGSVALPFQPKSFAQELADCQRYYEKSYNYTTFPGTASDDASFYLTASGINLRTFVPFKVTKMIIPTVTCYAVATGTINKATNVDDSNADVTITVAAEGHGGYQAAISSTDEYRYRWHWTADAEL